MKFIEFKLIIAFPDNAKEPEGKKILENIMKHITECELEDCCIELKKIEK